MKKFIENFRKIIRFVVTIFASREFAFIYALIGTLSQIAHTYFLTESISSFDGGFKIFQAVLVSTFISSSLLYFVAIADDTNTKENRRIIWAVNIFMVIEILINIYYYARHLIIDSAQWQLFDFIFAVLVSCLLPITIKLYASHIKAKDWILEIENSKNNNDEYSNNNNIIVGNIEEIENVISNKLNIFYLEIEDKIDTLRKDVSDDKLKDFIKQIFEDSLDSNVAEIFKKNQTLFLSQFENKFKMLQKMINDIKIDETKQLTEIKISE